MMGRVFLGKLACMMPLSLLAPKHPYKALPGRLQSMDDVFGPQRPSPRPVSARTAIFHGENIIHQKNTLPGPGLQITSAPINWTVHKGFQAFDTACKPVIFESFLNIA